MTNVVVEYLGALQAERGATRNTLDAYRRDLTDFTQFLNDHRRSLGRAGPDDIVDYLERLRTRGLGPSSVARHVSALRGLYKHLVRAGALRRDPTEHLEALRRPRALPRTLSREAAAALVESPDVTHPRGVRDRTLLELLYATGMRASECLGLTLDDVNLTAGYVVCTGKGRKQRLVPVGGEAVQWVRRYLREIRPTSTRTRDSGRLFVNPRGGRLSRQSLWAIVRQAAARAGLRQESRWPTRWRSCASGTLACSRRVRRTCCATTWSGQRRSGWVGSARWRSRARFPPSNQAPARRPCAACSSRGLRSSRCAARRVRAVRSVADSLAPGWPTHRPPAE